MDRIYTVERAEDGTQEVREEYKTRDQWLTDRLANLGASEVATILGLNPWATPWEVWAEKRGLLEPWRGNAATTAGQMLERAVLDHAESELGPLKRNVRVLHPELQLASTLDAMLDDGRPVEAKTTGIVGPIYGHWGETGSDQVPDNYLVQVHAQLMCTGADMGYLYALVPGRGILEFNIEANDQLHQQLANRIADWWERHIVQGHEPAHTRLPSLEVVKRLRKTPEKVIEGSTELVDLLDYREGLKKGIKSASDEVEEIETKIRMLLADAEEANLPDGRVLSLSLTQRKGYTVEPCEYRQLRVKRGKAS